MMYELWNVLRNDTSPHTILIVHVHRPQKTITSQGRQFIYLGYVPKLFPSTMKKSKFFYVFSHFNYNDLSKFKSILKKFSSFETKLSIPENVNATSDLFFNSRVYPLYTKDFYKIHDNTMAPYVKRFFQIDGNSPKKTPSKSPKSPQSPPSPVITNFARFVGLRAANDDHERRKYEKTTGRLLPLPQESK